MTKSRRKAREAALRALYQMEIAKVTAREAGADLFDNADLTPDLLEFADTLVRMFAVNKKLIDSKLASLIRDWDFTRIASVDRNILRIASVELMFMPGIPPAVTINEAIEIAKRYSTPESGRFVNGVLGNLLKDTPKAEWDPEMEERPEPADSEEEEVLEETVSAEEADDLLKGGMWKVRSE